MGIERELADLLHWQDKLSSSESGITRAKSLRFVMFDVSMMFQLRGRVARRLLLFTIHPHKRNISDMRTGVLVVAILFMLNDWGGQRHSARSATPWTTIEDPAAKLQLEAGAAATWAGFASSKPTTEIRDSKSRVDFDSQI